MSAEKREALADAGLAYCGKCYELCERAELNDDGLCPVCAEPGKIHQVGPLRSDPGRERYVLEKNGFRFVVANDRGHGFGWTIYTAAGAFVRSGYTRGKEVVLAFAQAQREAMGSEVAAGEAL